MGFDEFYNLLMRGILVGVLLIMLLGIWIGVAGGVLLMNGWFAP